MAYTPKTWVCGETITADGLNNIEEGIQDALECCEGGGGDCGYSCTETYTLVTDETATTVIEEGVSYAYAELSYSWEMLENVDKVKVTFDGTEYICQRNESNGCFGAEEGNGGIDWSEYPFCICSSTLTTESAGTYSVKIEALGVSVEVSDCFALAVNDVSGTQLIDIIPVFDDQSGMLIGQRLSETAESIYDEFIEKHKITFVADGSRYAQIIGYDHLYGCSGGSYYFTIHSAYMNQQSGTLEIETTVFAKRAGDIDPYPYYYYNN